MSSLTLLCVIAAVLAFTDVVLCKPVLDEPICTSRYNFESSLLKDMVKLDFDMSVLKHDYGDDILHLKAETKATAEKLETATRKLEESQEQTVSDLTALGEAQKKASDDKIQELEAAKNKLQENLETATRKLEESQEQAVSDLTALGETQKKASDDKIQELEAAKTKLQDDLNTRFSTFELKMETKLDEIRAAAIKRPVAFLVKTLPDIASGKNKILKFTESIWNTNNVYDSSSGYFTAPVNGTYMFHLQLCYNTKQYVHAQMVADGVVITNAILYDADGGVPCSTLSAVTVLTKGGRVCAMLGIEYSKGGILYQEETNRWASFMGALVN